VRFFFDNNLSPKLARSLHVLVEPEHHVVHLKERSAANTPDEIWMRALAGEEGWIIVSGDIRIAKNPHEIEAWRAAGHTTFFLKKGWINLGFWDQTQKFVKCFPEIIAAAGRAKSGSMFFVTVNGKIEGK
jgi:PIN domain-containing protein